MAAWRYISDDSVTASFGLAGDEFLMAGYRGFQPRPPTLRLYTYRSHCVIVGRFQNVEAELNPQVALCFGGKLPDLEAGLNVPDCRIRGIAINRRLTGGGTIVMGEDQLGMALVTSTRYPDTPAHPREILERYSRGVLEGLRGLGIDACFRPKNDIEVGGRKIAGLGTYIDEDDVLLFHTSLLVDLDIPLMLSLLNIPFEKISDKEVASFQERLTTVSRELGRQLKPPDIRENIKRGFEKALGIEFSAMPFSEAEVSGIRGLERERYQTSEWVYQRTRSPDMVGTSLKKTEAGLLRIYVALNGSVIKSILITGDFFSTSQTINDIEAKLRWSPVERAKIEETLERELSAGGRYIMGLSPETLTEAILDAAANAKLKGGP